MAGDLFPPLERGSAGWADCRTAGHDDDSAPVLPRRCRFRRVTMTGSIAFSRREICEGEDTKNQTKKKKKRF